MNILLTSLLLILASGTASAVEPSQIIYNRKNLDAIDTKGFLSQAYRKVSKRKAHRRWVDNRDGTITDKKTGLMWEKKLPMNHPECTDTIQDNRSVHCVWNRYTWTDTSDGDLTNPDGTVFTVFLAELNEDVFLGHKETCFAKHCDWRIPRLSELETLEYPKLCPYNPSYPAQLYVPPMFCIGAGETASFTSRNNGTEVMADVTWNDGPPYNQPVARYEKKDTAFYRAVRSTK